MDLCYSCSTCFISLNQYAPKSTSTDRVWPSCSVAPHFLPVAAGSGESDIRKWIIENDWLEAIIALPEQMFYNTGIATYIWIVTNRKEDRRKGKIQLLDSRDLWKAGGSQDNRRSLGDKRRHITGEHIDELVLLYGRFDDGDRSKIFDNEDFGYTRVTVEQPLRLRYQMTIEDKSRFPRCLPVPARRCAGHRQGIGDAIRSMIGMRHGRALPISCMSASRAGRR